MYRWFVYCLWTLLGLLTSVPALWAQDSETAPAATGSADTLAYTVALLSTLLVLLIVCKPSRKS